MKRMVSRSSPSLEQFQSRVALRFQLYNSLFTSLPFDRVENTGILLSLFLTSCEEGYAKGKNPIEIVDAFFRDHVPPPRERLDLLFRFVQYAERQVVLFDALEDAAFDAVNDPNGAGTLKDLESAAAQNDDLSALAEKLKSFSVRLVLTAHPTQFYPDSVLGIINDLIEAITDDRISDINTYLQQLGRTPFIKQEKPSPYDEALSLVWYLENVFYDAVGAIAAEINEVFGGGVRPIRMGFWPGGDRDGNPFVTADTTVKTAVALRAAILRSYRRDVRQLKRRLTFSGVASLLSDLETTIRDGLRSVPINSERLLGPLLEIRQVLNERHNGLFSEMVDALIVKVRSFGVFFASLDVRQDSSVHSRVLKEIFSSIEIFPGDYTELDDTAKIAGLLAIETSIDAEDLGDELAADTIKTIAAIRQIQEENGAEACHRYIISHCQSAVNVIEVYGLFLLAGWKPAEMAVDIVPLFETVEDLRNAAGVIRELYQNTDYRTHLERRGLNQFVMLGFSDGTKDGGYLAANWSIYKAKKELSAVSWEFGINVVFFDGRGGPPARGGGKTHRFYSSMGNEISDRAIELTIQGQTVSSNFGTVAAARFNMEQLLHAGLYKELVAENRSTFSPEEEVLMEELGAISFRAYEELKHNPKFLDYLLRVSPLRFYGETNIGSRPVKRGGSDGKPGLDDLRAIPFVGSWSQLKQNVPGFYGVGSAIKAMDEAGRLDAVSRLYHSNPFFRALMDNCEMAMEKCDFHLTGFLADDAEFGELWRAVRDEFELTKGYLFRISGKAELMEDYPVERLSIQMRERIMLPLATIQQYALMRLRNEAGLTAEATQSLEKLTVRCSFGIINAGRNSA
ncbi:MAG: phosphoenolpyruvate carboxylase [Pyrinomonadaceae bacterium]